MNVLRDHPVRKNKKQKLAFQEAVRSYAKQLGYEAVVEKVSLGTGNILMGDPEKAKYLITAHYDTCAGLPFPNLITPCNFWLFLGWQLLLTLILCVPVGVIGGLAGVLSGNAAIAVPCAYLLLILELVWMFAGAANKHNANDNTSGVVTVLETAAALPAELRDRVCFVLFDLEEAGLLGSSAYRKAHRKASGGQLVLNLDCVGEGDEILLFPTKMLAKKASRMEQLKSLCNREGEKSSSVRATGFRFYPSDQANFPLGLGIASFCRSKWAGLYLGKIHTRNDTNLDEKNVALLRDLLISVIREQA